MPNENEGGGFGGGEPVDFPTELKKWADAIKATTEAINAVAETLDEHAARSVIIEVNNTTSRTLRLHGSGDHDWGDFGKLPPDSIPPRKTPDPFTSQSDKPFTGTQGNVRYLIDDDGTLFHVEWNNPFLGDNECLCRVEGLNAGLYITSHLIGGGNTGAHARFMLGEKADANKSESGWITCKNCKALFFGLDEGHCAARPLGIASAPTDDQVERMRAPLPGGLSPAPSNDLFIQRPQGSQGPGPGGLTTAPSDFGIYIQGPRQEGAQVDPATAGRELYGKHEAAGDAFRLRYGYDGPNRVAQWRRCAHCKGLFYDGYASKGVCPGRRGGHVAEAGGREFQLAYEMTLPAELSPQDNWRYCDKCQGLFYLPQNADSVCPAGENHHAASESYVLERVIS